MFLIKVVLYILSLANTFGMSSFHLSELIEKIYQENDSDNVCFIGTNNEFVSEFIRSHRNIKVLIITSLTEAYKEMPYMSILVIDVSLHQEHKITPSTLEKFIQILRVRKFVIVMSDDFEKLHDYFMFFKENKFTRIFGISDNIIYSYLPYADNQIQHVQSDDTHLPNALKDLNGLVFRTTVQRNLPRTFWYTTKEGQRKIGGCFGQIFLGFLRRHNATFKEIIINNSTEMFMPGIVNATINNQIDISMNAYGSSKDIESTYPVKFGRFLVMVPLNGYVDPIEYFKRPFSPIVWLMVVVILAYIVMMDIIVKITTNMPVNFWKSFSQMFLALIGLPREKPVTTAYRLHIQVLFLAFVLVNLYVISFTSFLTVFIKVKQFNTLQDLIDNNFKVLLADYVWGAIAQGNNYPPGFENIVTTVDYKTYLREMYSMKNISFAYALGADTSELLIRFQACFGKPLFHMTRDSLLGYNLGFLTALHSPFKEVLSDYIFDVMQTGLIDKWDHDVVTQASGSGIEDFNVHRGNSRMSSHVHVALTVPHLLFCWKLLAIGWTVSLFVFVGENLSSILKILCNFIKFPLRYYC